MKRKILRDGIYDECKLEMETTGHVLWNCQKAKETWAYSKIVVSFGEDRFESFHDLLWHLMMTDRMEEAKITKVVMIAWALWCNWNEVRNGGKRKTRREIINWADTYLVEYSVAIEAP